MAAAVPRPGEYRFKNHLFGKGHRCAIYVCAQRECVEYCGTCNQFPCAKRHPYIEKAEWMAREIKAFLGAS